MLRMMMSRGRKRVMLRMMMCRRRKMMILRRRRSRRRRRRTDHNTPECGHTVSETHVAPGIVRGQMDKINVCKVKNPCVPMRSTVKIIPHDKSCSNSFQWLCHLFRMAHRDETTKCYLRQLRVFTQYVTTDCFPGVCSWSQSRFPRIHIIFVFFLTL